MIPSRDWVRRHRWALIFLFPYYALAVILAAALVGAIGHVVIGLIFTDRTFAFLLRKGLYNGGFYGMIWSFGISFVICVVQAHGRPEEPSPVSKTDQDVY